MQNVVIDKPYAPVPPRTGWFWPKVLGYYVPRLLRQSYGVREVRFTGTDHLQRSLEAGHGILLAANHSRDEDPLVLGLLSRAAGRPFFIMASWHLFMQGRVKAFLLPRAGAFSVYREGIDRAAFNTAVAILEQASRPLVVFPEGHVSRTNERLNDLMEGTALMARTAARRRAKHQPPGRVVVHPVAIRYRFHGDIQAVVSGVLDEVETRLTWTPQRQLPSLARIAKVGEALLALKELEYLGSPQPGRVGERLPRLIHAVLAPLEDQWAAGKHDGTVNARVKRLRSAILPDMIKGELSDGDRARRWRHLADAYLAQQLAHYPPGYLSETAPPERFLETVERFEEDLTDKVRVHGPLSATVTVGAAIPVSPERESRGETDPLLRQVGEQWRQLLGLGAEVPEAQKE